ncbi:MAG: DDE-type integrase/transposase/recombinase [Candidatus Bipolaricaulia bacterium]
MNEEWQTDLIEFGIAGFGTYYFMGMEDVFSRYVLAWTLSPTQTADVAVEVVERAWATGHRRKSIRSRLKN